ncbi:GNAT family N-acetyltransferase [Blastococcus sp. SYSU D00820]
MSTDTALTWEKDPDPRWDEDRERIFASVPEAVFPTLRRVPGEPLTSDWWRVRRSGRVIGYGWLDDVWGDAEILLAVEEAARGTGAGEFALAHLEREAAARGVNYVLNVVRADHPRRDEVTAWFLAHGFTGAEDGRLRKFVADRPEAPGRDARRTGAPEDDARHARFLAERERARSARAGRAGAAEPVGVPLGPGEEESGGYVDQERHRY